MFSEVLLTVTCLLNQPHASLTFEVNKENQVQSVQVFNNETAQSSYWAVSNQEVSESKVTFFAQDLSSGELAEVTLNIQEGPSYGGAFVRVGSNSESTSCHISKWQ